MPIQESEVDSKMKEVGEDHLLKKTIQVIKVFKQVGP